MSRAICVLIICLFAPNAFSQEQELLKQLKTAPDKDVIRIAQKLSSLGWNSPEGQEILAEKLESKNVKVRGACVDAIPYLGEPSSEVIDAIFDSMQKGGTIYPDAIRYVEVAAEALGRIGPKALPMAIDRLSTEDLTTYFGTTDYLHRLGPAGKKAVPALISRLKPGKRLWASVYALAGIGKEAKAATPKLVELLDSKEFNTVCIACRALAAIGPDAKSAKAKLLEKAKKGNVSERGRALQALGGIGVAAEEDVKPLFEENLNAFHQTIKERTMQGIGLLGEEAGKVYVELVQAAIESPKFHNKPFAALALHQIGGPEELVIKTLNKALKDPTFELDVIQKYGDLGKDGKQALSKLIPYLDSQDDYLRALAIESVGKIGLDVELKVKLESIVKSGEYLSARTARRVLQEAEKEQSNKFEFE